MKKIIIDTNFLLIPAELKVDIFAEIKRVIPQNHDLYILDATINELEKIKAEQKRKTREYATIALSLIKQKHLKIIPTFNNHNVDDKIVSIVDKNYIVATQDKGLKKRIKSKGVSVIILKQKKYLDLEV